jgi:ABC-2 type transport system permease protein
VSSSVAERATPVTTTALELPPSTLGKDLGVFYGLILRDVRVMRRNLFEFLSQTLMQPLLFVFVFTYVFPKIGQNFTIGHGITFATLIVPGLIGTSALFSGISSVATPLAVDFGATKEIEDRALSPLPVWALGLEKILWGSFQALIAAAVVFPLVYLIPATPVSVHVSSWPMLIAVTIMICVTSGALGLTLGSIVKPHQIGLMYGVLVIPLTFLGCVYYPWKTLQPVPWLHWAVLINPLVYTTEGMRDALTPILPHMPVWAFLGVGYAIVALFLVCGLRLFVRRVVS